MPIIHTLVRLVSVLKAHAYPFSECQYDRHVPSAKLRKTKREGNASYHFSELRVAE